MNNLKPDESGSGLFELLGGPVLKRHWRTFAVAAIATPLAAGVAHFLIPPTFVSESRVLVKLGREFMGPPLASGRLGAMYRLNEAINSEIEILSSREIAVEAVQHIGIEVLYPEVLEDAESSEMAAQTAAATLLTFLSTTGVAESSVIRVAFAHTDRELARDTLSTLIERFQARHLNVFSGHELPVADEVVRAVRTALSEAEEARARYRRESGVFDANEERLMLLQRREEVEQLARSLRSQREALEKGEDEAYVDVAGQTELDELNALTAEEKGLLQNYYPESGPVQSIRAKIESRRSTLRDRVKRRQEELSASESEAELSLEDVTLALNTLELHERALRELDRSVGLHERRLEDALGTRQAAEFDAKLDEGDVTSVVVIDRPTLPLEPVGIGFIAKVAVGGLAGILIGGSLVMLLHLLARNRRDGEPHLLTKDEGAFGAQRHDSIKLSS